ncbi:dihydroneopterin aldolase [Tessaracoccus caeni]|uniref:dihydroneopterin aldolase n=1 Tax=Tessaracoccus caeni TaxID=3031239 RepID=UPI0023DC9731|nr:dihydroneopterin aldolase [Tessaracoccus caeni]MDF1487728.1 dihydroneopterin aldolase [Tessaracoccus caeni]
MDKIVLSGIRAVGHHGVFAHERRDGQPFVVDVELRLPVDEISDRLENTVNYAEVAQAVEDVITGEPRDLIETVAGDVAARCLSFPRVESVQVTVHKPKAPLSQSFTDVAVTITRSMND